MQGSMIIELTYILAAILFIFGIKLLASPKTATKGNFISAVGMLLAVIITLLNNEIISYQWILLGFLAGSVVGVIWAQKIQMTAMPEMVAVFNGFGGGASLLVAWAEYLKGYQAYAQTLNISTGTLLAISTTALIGGITFSGSMLAYAKLSGKISGRAIILPGLKHFNIIALLAVIVLCYMHCQPQMLGVFVNYKILLYVIALSLMLGVTSVLPIGGADMPVVISLLNSYSGIAACGAGFILTNNVLIVVGALVGASGIILTKIMCKSMNRSLANVLFSGFGSKTQISKVSSGEVKSLGIEDAYYILEAARSVLIVPGYGMAVAQAQHVVKELVDFLEDNGADVKYAIHPVAGRMPGHMNVLLAEAKVPYEQLVEPDDVNPVMESIDICIVIGANDVVNPAANTDKESPIYGMPIIEVDKAKNVLILKRSMNAGFSGLANPLFSYPNASLVFGDGKSTIASLVAEFKAIIA